LPSSLIAKNAPPVMESVRHSDHGTISNVAEKLYQNITHHEGSKPCSSCRSADTSPIFTIMISKTVPRVLTMAALKIHFALSSGSSGGLRKSLGWGGGSHGVATSRRHRPTRMMIVLGMERPKNTTAPTHAGAARVRGRSRQRDSKSSQRAAIV
jgi:hypothetical protein